MLPHMFCCYYSTNILNFYLTRVVIDSTCRIFICRKILKMNLGTWITYFLIKWNQEHYTLLRIRVIMGILMLLYYMMFSFSMNVSFFGRRTVLSFLDTVTDTILVYILGAMQAVPFKNPMFPVWAVLLVSLRSSSNVLSRYGTHFELRNVFKLLAVAYMNVTHGSVWRIQFWVFWSLLVLKCFYRILASYRASKSLWHGRSSELLQVYMGPDHDRRNFNLESCNPYTMEGYKYLVYGESLRSSRNNAESLRIDNCWSIITLEQIWRCNEDMLTSVKWQGNNMQDLCLAFSLSRLLRCRLEGVTLHARTVSMTRKLVCSRISTENVDADKVLFGILDMDLVFLRDYLYSSYPMLFTGGLLWPFFPVISYFLKLCLFCFTIVGLTVRYLLDHKFRALFHWGHSFNADTILMGTAMVFALCMEQWEVHKLLTSNWKRLFVTCRLVNCSDSSMRDFLRGLFNIPDILLVWWKDPRVPTTGQYIFLQSFNYSPWKWKLVHLLTMGIVECKVNGTKPSRPIILRENVKRKVFESLHSLPSMGTDSLPRDFAALLVNDLAERYWSACLEVTRRCSHVILVWHIATSLCEMKLAQDLKSSGFLKSALSFLRKRWSRRYIVHENLDGNLRTYSETANCLSRYCAYLLVSRPELLPENIWVSKQTFQDTVQCAREILKGCDSPQSMYDRLIATSQEALPGEHNTKLNGNILQQGAMLGKMLIDNENQESRWEILAEVWVRLLVNIAPSSNAEAHAKYLDCVVEFITQIWALFTHCGIEKSELWQEDAAPGSNARLASSSSPGPVDATRVQQTTVASGIPAAAQPNGQTSDLEDDEDIPEIVVIRHQADDFENDGDVPEITVMSNPTPGTS